MSTSFRFNIERGNRHYLLIDLTKNMQTSTLSKIIFLAAIFITTLFMLLNVFVIAPSYEKYSLEQTGKAATKIANHLSRMIINEQLVDETASKKIDKIYREIISDFNLESITLFSLNGDVLYSSFPEASRIANNGSSFEEAKEGLVSSRNIAVKNANHNGPTVIQNLVETHIPLLEQGKLKGVLEITFNKEADETRLANITRNNTFILLVLVLVTFSLIAIVALKYHKNNNITLLSQSLKHRAHPFIFIGATVFLLEFILVLILHPVTRNWPSLMTSWIEGGLLLVFLTPALYYFQVVPLVEVITDKRKVEESLRESEKLFKTTFYDAPIGSAIVSLDGIISNVNTKLAQFLGYEVEELLGKNFIDIVHPDCQQNCHNKIIKLISGEKTVYNKDKQLVTKNGQYTWGYLSVKVVTDEANVPQYLLPMIEDINARKDMEQEVAHAWEDWEETFTHIPDGIVILNNKLEIVRANPAFKKLLMTQDEQGKKFYDVLRCNRRPKCEHYTLFKQCIIDRGTLPFYPYTYECFNDVLDKYLELTVNTYRTSDPDTTGFVFIVRDVTERKITELAITESEKRYSLLAENVSDIIWTMDLDLKLTYVSPSVETVRGFSPAEMMEMSLEDSLPQESVKYVKGVLQEQLALEQEGKVTPDRYINMEIAAYRKDRSLIWLELRVCFIRDENNIPTGILGVSRDISVRKESDLRLRLLEKAVNTTRTGITFRDTENVIRYINPADAAMHGYEPRELLGRHIKTIAPLRYINSLDRKTMTSLTTWSRESVNLRKDGSEFPVALVSDVVKDDSGEILGVITTCEDITERVKIEKELRKLSRAIEQSPVSVVITDQQGTIEYVNPGFCKNTGYSFEEAIGQNPRILKSGLHSVALYSDLWETITSGNIWRGELSNKNKAGEIFWENAVISPIKDNDGRITNYIAVKENITEQKKAKDAILSREARLRSIMDGVTDSLITVDENAVIESCNPATATMFGFSAKELIGKKVQMLLPQVYHQRVEKFFRLQRRSNPAPIGKTLTMRGLRKDGSLFPLSLSLGTAKLEDRTLFAVTVRDISEIKINQRALLEAKANAESANAAKSDFLARMSHEIRTPINAIIGMSNLVKMTTLDPQQSHYVNNIFGASQSLLLVINDILDFSKIEAGHLPLESIEFRLDDLFNNLKNIVGLTAYDKRIDLMFNIDESVPDILIGDSLRIEQVLTNLVNNAVKFTSEGEVTIEVRTDFIDEKTAAIEFSVRDTGIGMDPSQVENLFCPFTQADGSITRQYGGTGLGLTICKRLVEMMGSRIWVTSEVGKGSIFTFKLELPYRSDITGFTYNFGELKAIVVDPNPESRKMLELFLKSARISTAAAGQIEDGYQAFLGMSGCGAEHPDLLIVDTTSSSFQDKNIEGWLNDHPSVKNIFITGLAINPELKNSDRHSVYLSKPIIKSQLLETVKRVMQLSSPQEKPVIGRFEHINTDQILHGKKVLLAEDNAINQLYAVKILEKKGIEVDTVKNGAEALEAVCSTPYDLVLMDMEMPVMDGLKATEAIRCIPACTDLPIIAMTAHAMEEHRQLALNSGMDDYIPKPIDLKNLEDILLKWLIQENEALSPEFVDGDEAEDLMPWYFPGIDTGEGLSRMSGDRDLYLKVLTFFHETYADAVGILPNCMKYRKYSEAIHFVHSLNGAAGNIGAHKLNLTGKELEAALMDKQGEVKDELIQRFEDELCRVVDGLASLPGEKETETYEVMN